jgi:hypothetical protein
MRHKLEIAALKRTQLSRDTRPVCNCETRTCSLAGCTGRNATTNDTYPSFGFPDCSSLSIRRQAHRHASFPYKLEDICLSGDCALALAHLDLPALSWLCLTAFSVHPPIKSDVQQLLPFIARHAHGPQDTQPLQSVLIHSGERRADILAWPVSNIGNVEMHDLLTSCPETPPTRVALSFRSDAGSSPEDRLEILDIVMACLPWTAL